VRLTQVQEGYFRKFVNYDQHSWYQLLLLAEHPYNNSATNAHTMTPFFAKYGFHPPTEWIKEREAPNPRVTMYAHWMQDIHQQGKQTLENTQESRKTYYEWKAMEQPNIEACDLVILNAKKP